jgi:hypothetical protein
MLWKDSHTDLISTLDDPGWILDPSQRYSIAASDATRQPSTCRVRRCESTLYARPWKGARSVLCMKPKSNRFISLKWHSLEEFYFSWPLNIQGLTPAAKSTSHRAMMARGLIFNESVPVALCHWGHLCVYSRNEATVVQRDFNMITYYLLFWDGEPKGSSAAALGLWPFSPYRA